MTEIETQELWVRLMTEKGDLCEMQAVAYAAADLDTSMKLSARQSQVMSALHSLKEARAIRELLAKIERVGEK